MERIGFYLLMIPVIALIGLFVKSIVVISWESGKLDSDKSESMEDAYDYFVKDLHAIVLRVFTNKIAFVSSLLVFAGIYLLTNVGIFSATGYSVATYSVIYFVVPWIKRQLKTSKSSAAAPSKSD